MQILWCSRVGGLGNHVVYQIGILEYFAIKSTQNFLQL